jgi:hypothetical protein
MIRVSRSHHDAESSCVAGPGVGGVTDVQNLINVHIGVEAALPQPTIACLFHHRSIDHSSEQQSQRVSFDVRIAG